MAKKVKTKKVKKKVKVETKPKQYYAIRDINLEIRKGDVVPEQKVKVWKHMGIKWELLVELR